MRLPNNRSLEHRLTPRKDDVLAMLKEYGETQTMAHFGIKTKRTFREWVTKYAPTPTPPPSPDIFSTLKGGEKAQWLRVNRDAVIGVCNSKGDDEAMRLWNITPSTLGDLKHFGKICYVPPNSSRIARADIRSEFALSQVEALWHEIDLMKGTDRINNEAIIEVRNQQDVIVHGVNELVPIITENLGKVLTPLVEAIVGNIKIERRDPLLVKNLIEDARWSEQKQLTSGQCEVIPPTIKPQSVEVKSQPAPTRNVSSFLGKLIHPESEAN